MKIPPIHAAAVISILLVVLLIVVFVIKSKYDAGGAAAGGQSPTDMGSIIIYGSNGCGWCKKQKDYMDKKGMPYTFIDCPTETCPGFVKSYPTIMVNGTVLPPGYNELGGPLTQ
jgi:hypothetical protein